MVVKGDHFQANGIPSCPSTTPATWNPYQVVDITVKDSGTNAVLVQTRATVPTSDEINCGKCHGADPLLDVLQKHDDEEGTTPGRRPAGPLRLLPRQSRPWARAGRDRPDITCPGPSTASTPRRGATCYDCHPGATTKCSRSIAHTAADGNCIACHGTMHDVASSIATGTRIPWVQRAPVRDLPCRHRRGRHGDDALPERLRTCRPLLPGLPRQPARPGPDSSQAADNYQAIQYQTAVRTIGDCKVCHATSKGEGIDGVHRSPRRQPGDGLLGLPHDRPVGRRCHTGRTSSSGRAAERDLLPTSRRKPCSACFSGRPCARRPSGLPARPPPDPSRPSTSISSTRPCGSTSTRPATPRTRASPSTRSTRRPLARIQVRPPPALRLRPLRPQDLRRRLEPAHLRARLRHHVRRVQDDVPGPGRDGPRLRALRPRSPCPSARSCSSSKSATSATSSTRVFNRIIDPADYHIIREKPALGRLGLRGPGHGRSARQGRFRLPGRGLHGRGQGQVQGRRRTG